MSKKQFINSSNRQFLDSIKKGNVETTGNTLTTINVIPLKENITVISALVMGTCTGGNQGVIGDGLGFSILGVFKLENGVASQIGTSTTDPKRDQANWNVSFDVSNGNVILQVTGAVQTSIKWKSQYEIITL